MDIDNYEQEQFAAPLSDPPAHEDFDSYGPDSYSQLAEFLQKNPHQDLAFAATDDPQQLDAAFFEMQDMFGEPPMGHMLDVENQPPRAHTTHMQPATAASPPTPAPSGIFNSEGKLKKNANLDRDFYTILQTMYSKLPSEEREAVGYKKQGEDPRQKGYRYFVLEKVHKQFSRKTIRRYLENEYWKKVWLNHLEEIKEIARIKLQKSFTEEQVSRCLEIYEKAIIDPQSYKSVKETQTP